MNGMDCCRFMRVLVVAAVLIVQATAAWTQSSASNKSASPQRTPKPAATKPATSVQPDPGSVSKGIYRNSSFGFICKIPEGWVLRTDELNAEGVNAQGTNESESNAKNSAKNATSKSRVLLATFARPPEAHGEDINSSILIAAESAAAYPGLKDAGQYLDPVTEVAKSQGFELIEEPYEMEIGTKTIDRADFQMDIGSRKMLQSTLVVLSRGYLVSFTFIGGTEDEVEELVDGLSFPSPVKSAK
jgi:hypothetical protein